MQHVRLLTFLVIFLKITTFACSNNYPFPFLQIVRIGITEHFCTVFFPCAHCKSSAFYEAECFYGTFFPVKMDLKEKEQITLCDLSGLMWD